MLTLTIPQELQGYLIPKHLSPGLNKLHYGTMGHLFAAMSCNRGSISKVELVHRLIHPSWLQ